jgi:AcrR family transcriptional regulator
MKAEYRSAIRSRKMIRKSFLELLKEKDISKITVTDIVNKADLNRSTFYAHYVDVRAITEEMENEVIDKMIEILKKFEFKNFFNNPTPLLLEVSRFLESNEETYKILLKVNEAESFLKKLKNEFAKYMISDTDIPEYLKDSKMVNLRISYFAGGIINMYQDWFSGNLNCSLNDIALEVSKLLSLEANELFGRKD